MWKSLLASCALLVGCLVSMNSALPIGSTIVSLGTENELQIFDSEVSKIILVRATGMATSYENLVALDYRPSNGKVYALSDANLLYTVDLDTGVLSVVGQLDKPFVSKEATISIDWNPFSDELRVVDSRGANAKVTFDSGLTVIYDDPISYFDTDENSDLEPRVAGIAFANSVPGSSATVLYALENDANRLATLPLPSGGTLTTVEEIGKSLSRVTGFDIVSADNEDDVALFSKARRFFELSLTSGKAERRFASSILDRVTVKIISLTIVPPASQ